MIGSGTRRTWQRQLDMASKRGALSTVHMHDRGNVRVFYIGRFGANHRGAASVRHTATLFAVGTSLLSRGLW